MPQLYKPVDFVKSHRFGFGLLGIQHFEMTRFTYRTKHGYVKMSKQDTLITQRSSVSNVPEVSLKCVTVDNILFTQCQVARSFITENHSTEVLSGIQFKFLIHWDGFT